MFSNNISINSTLIDNRITEIESICEHMLEIRDNIKAIDDNYSEGIYYSKYLECITEIGDVIDSSENAIRGYIIFLQYIKNNYLTMDEKLANAIKEIDIVK